MSHSISRTISRPISRTLLLFGITSFFADIAGDMLFPILPMYFTVELGLSVGLLGVIEGIADGTANLVQVWFGWISDRLKKRKLFVILGYVIAALGKFFLALGGSPLPGLPAGSAFMVFLARFFDRGGKGIRTTPRDAMLAESVVKERRGFAFGFHRAMDTAGAIVGNAIVIWLLSMQFSLHSIVWLSLIPAGLAIFFLLPVREPTSAAIEETPTNGLKKKVSIPNWSDFTSDRKKFGSEFWKFIFVSVLFHLGKISYAFLLLRVGDFGIGPEAIPYLYIIFNIVQTVFSIPVGKLADGFGKAILVFMSFLLFALMSAGFIAGGDSTFMMAMFALYGLSFAFIEVGIRAFAVELSPHHLKATGMGIFFTVTGLTVILASWIGGSLWELGGGAATFWYSTVMTGLAAVMFFAFFHKRIIGAFQRLR